MGTRRVPCGSAAGDGSPGSPDMISTMLCEVTGNHDLRGSQGIREPDPAVVSDRYRCIVDVYALLRRRDGMILLLERSGTGYADRQLCPPSGHLEAGESVVQGVIREAREEVGVLLHPGDLAFSHVVHHRNPLGQARIGFFFTASRWHGEPANLEPHRVCQACTGPTLPGRRRTPYPTPQPRWSLSAGGQCSPSTAGNSGRARP